LATKNGKGLERMHSVDIFIPCYNAEKYIKETLESIQEQSYSEYEVIIVNDGSTDDSEALVKDFMKKDARVKLYNLGANHGVQYVRNLSLELCKADYIAYMDADDIMPEQRLAHQMTYLSCHPECDILSAGMTLMTESGQVREELLFGELDSEAIYAALFFRNIIPTGTTVLKREFVQSRGLRYDENFVSIGDYNFWVDCMLAGAAMHSLNESLQYYRVVPGGISRANSTPEKIKRRNESFDCIHNKILEHYGITLTDGEKRVYLDYTNEEAKQWIKKLKDLPYFQKALASLERQAPFSKEVFHAECMRFRKKYYKI
jgi:glycosyltransferase involved in cell wall biosynthesis